MASKDADGTSAKQARRLHSNQLLFPYYSLGKLR